MSTIALVLTLAQLVVNVVLSVGVAYATYTGRRVNDLKVEIRRQTSDLIDTKITNVTERCTAAIKALNQHITRINTRLAEGEREFRQLGDRDTKLELKLGQIVADLRDTIRQECASKTGQQSLSEQVRKLEITLARRTGDQA